MFKPFAQRSAYVYQEYPLIIGIPLTLDGQSFARIAAASPDQLQNLPGFGRIKVKNLSTAIGNPIRNQTINTLPQAFSQQPTNPGLASTSTLADAPETVSGDTITTQPESRGSSPTWDIELDLDS